MDKKSNKSLIPSQGGMFSDLLVRVKLIGKLMADRRVSFWLKLIPVGTLAYLISPIDLIPGRRHPPGRRRGRCGDHLVRRIHVHRVVPA